MCKITLYFAWQEPVLDALDALDHHPVTSPFYRPFNQSLEESGMSRGKM